MFYDRPGYAIRPSRSVSDRMSTDILCQPQVFTKSTTEVIRKFTALKLARIKKAMARKRKKKKRRERRLNNVQKPASKRPSKLRQWTDDGMVRALNAVQSGILGVNDESTTSKSPAKPVTFSAEMVKKFERRFENGYNIYTDPAYVQWMRMYHPDHLPPG